MLLEDECLNIDEMVPPKIPQGILPTPPPMVSQRCPQCSRKFKDYRSVLCHMNQPLGSCRSYTQELTTIREALAQYRSRKQAATITVPEADDHLSDDPMDWSNGFEELGEQDMREQNMGDQDMDEPSEDFVEEFVGAGEIYGRGTTFLNIFDNDPHASKHVDNLYYPFASKDEWELASFLLQSGMSMASINSFLSLTIVSFNNFNFY